MNLDLLTVPLTADQGLEIFDPVNAWLGAPSRIYVQVNTIVGGVYQVAYDPVADVYWLRAMKYEIAGALWSDWNQVAIKHPKPLAKEPRNG